MQIYNKDFKILLISTNNIYLFQIGYFNELS